MKRAGRDKRETEKRKERKGKNRNWLSVGLVLVVEV